MVAITQYNKGSFLERLASSYLTKVQNVVKDLEIFQYAFCWYLELAPKNVLYTCVKKASDQVKAIRSVSITWKVSYSASFFSATVADFISAPSGVNALSFFKGGIGLGSKGCSFLVWLKKNGVINLVLNGKDLSGPLSSAVSLLNIVKNVGSVAHCVQVLHSRPNKRAFLSTVLAVNQFGISLLYLSPVASPTLILSLKTADFLYEMATRINSYKTPVQPKLHIPYLSQKDICLAC